MTGTIHKKVQKFKAKKMRIGGDRGKKRKKERRNVDFIYCVSFHVTKFNLNPVKVYFLNVQRAIRATRKTHKVLDFNVDLDFFEKYLSGFSCLRKCYNKPNIFGEKCFLKGRGRELMIF